MTYLWIIETARAILTSPSQLRPQGQLPGGEAPERRGGGGWNRGGLYVHCGNPFVVVFINTFRIFFPADNVK
jgi:hypothetical protein